MAGRRLTSRDTVTKTMPDGTVRTYPAVAAPSGTYEDDAPQPVAFDIRQVIALCLILVGMFLLTFASGAMWGVWAGVLVSGALITLVGVLLAMG